MPKCDQLASASSGNSLEIDRFWFLILLCSICLRIEYIIEFVAVADRWISRLGRNHDIVTAEYDLSDRIQCDYLCDNSKRWDLSIGRRCAAVESVNKHRDVLLYYNSAHRCSSCQLVYVADTVRTDSLAARWQSMCTQMKQRASDFLLHNIIARFEHYSLFAIA